MNILLTGATGYIGKRLLPALVDAGHYVYCCVRDKSRFAIPHEFEAKIEVLEVDFLNPQSLEKIPEGIDGAYYLIHSMTSSEDFAEMEFRCAANFQRALDRTSVKHVVYLSGIINEEELSEHLASRKAVEEALGQGTYALTTLRAGIIIGSGSASFEIIRDLVEKLPIMIAPKWLNTKCQPIGIYNVIEFLTQSLFNESTYNQSFDIGGKDILTYKEMLLGYAKARSLQRWIYTVPVMTPRLSSYWLYFITSTSFNLAANLVDSMKVEVIARDDRLSQILGINTFCYQEALKRTVMKIDKNQIVSSWKDALISGGFDRRLSQFSEVPVYGCFVDRRQRVVKDREESLNRIWRIGGKTGWYYATFLWKIRGYMDKLAGGVGLRRGRRSEDQIEVGDAVDFWRVLYADKEKGRLLLFAEMKLPGDAWLEFKVKNNTLYQTATFYPKGVLGRLYWYAVLPFHGFIFSGMINKLSS